MSLAVRAWDRYETIDAAKQLDNRAGLVRKRQNERQHIYATAAISSLPGHPCPLPNRTPPERKAGSRKRHGCTSASFWGAHGRECA